MLSRKEVNYVRVQFLTSIKDPDKRSKILFVADALARDSSSPKDYLDAYWSIIGYFLDPSHDEDLERDFKELGGSLSSMITLTEYNELPPGILEEPKLKIKFKK